MKSYMFFRPEHRPIAAEFCMFLLAIWTVTYITLSLIEEYFTGFVTNFFDPQYLLIPIVIFGALGMAFHKPIVRGQVFPRTHFAKSLILTVVCSLFLGWLLWHRLKEFPSLASEVSLLSTAELFVFLLIVQLSSRATETD